MNRFDELNNNYQKVHHERLYEHLNGRVKSEASMEEKCTRKHYLFTAHSALREVREVSACMLSATLLMTFIPVLTTSRVGMM